MAEQRNVSVRVEGLADLRRRLKNVKGGLDDLKEVNRRAAKIVYEHAVLTTPMRTGALFSTGRYSGTRASGYVRFGNARVPYAAPVHWGWLTRPDPARDWRGGPFTANPWASLAAQISEPEWYEQYVREIERLWDR